MSDGGSGLAGGFLLNATGFDVALAGNQAAHTITLMRLFDAFLPLLASGVAIWVIATFPIIVSTAAGFYAASENERMLFKAMGASRWQTFTHVILPLTLPGVVTGAFLTFVLCIGDYITPQIRGCNSELTVPQLIMLQLGRSGNFPLASALSVVLMAVVTLAYFACGRWLRLDRV